RHGVPAFPAEHGISLRPMQLIPAALQRFSRASPRLARLTARRPPVQPCAGPLPGEIPLGLQPSKETALRPLGAGVVDQQRLACRGPARAEPNLRKRRCRGTVGRATGLNPRWPHLPGLLPSSTSAPHGRTTHVTLPPPT